MMKRGEAARYARWSAVVAVAILIFALGMYLRRRSHERETERQTPPPVPANVEQRSAGFSYSRTVGSRTLFSVHALRATEYKDQNRSTLQEVLITMYGTNGDRNDTISAHECNYLPSAGQIQCQGKVQIDLRNAQWKAKNISGEVHLETRDISFDPASETVWTPHEVTLQFPGGSGQATGLTYNTKDEVARLKSDVQLQLKPPGSPLPDSVSLTAGSLEYRRSAEQMFLLGPVTARQGQAQIKSGALEVQLSSAMNAKEVVASQRVQGTDTVARGAASFTAERVHAFLGTGSSIQRVIADGDVHSELKAPNDEHRFYAQHVDMTTAIRKGRIEPCELNASGEVHAEVLQNGVTRNLVTPDLHAEFAPRERASGVRVLNVNTSAPGEITVTRGEQADLVRAGRLATEFDSQGRLTKFIATGGVESKRQTGTKSPVVASAQNLAATFDGADEWATISESGAVKFQQAGQTATADRAVITRASGEVVLDGNAGIRDATSSTSAAHIEMNRSSGEVHASGSVFSSYFGIEGARPLSLDSGVAHISADRLDGSNAGHTETYSGKARLWQGNTTLDADAIQLWRDQKKLEARGAVRADLPGNSAESGKDKVPVSWLVRAPKLDYWNDAGKIDLTGGVSAQSSIGSLSGNAMEILVGPGSQNQQHLQRVRVDGNVRIEANGRIGTADRGEYTSNDGKFVLSGGQPTLSDAFGNTTTGRELTFFLANDTILVSSQEGSRTLTTHRVEK